MIIYLKNKHTLQIDDFFLNCSIGKNGLTINKKEGDKKTPKGIFEIENLYYRKYRISKPETSLKSIEIKNNMGWCDDVNFPTKYNKRIKISKKVRHEKLKRKDNKYDLLIPIMYNYKKPIPGLGSCIFILTDNYKPTTDALHLKRFLILAKIIKKNSKIKIF